MTFRPIVKIYWPFSFLPFIVLLWAGWREPVGGRSPLSTPFRLTCILVQSEVHPSNQGQMLEAKASRDLKEKSKDAGAQRQGEILGRHWRLYF